MRYSLLILLFISTSSIAQPGDTLVIATYQYADNPRVKNLEPFAAVFSNAVSVPVVVKSYPTVQHLLDGMSRKEADIVFINTFGFLLYKENNDDYTAAANLVVSADAESTYQSVIVSSAKSQIKRLDDIRKYSHQLDVLFVSPGSTSGNLYPRLKLASIGLYADSVFKSVTYTKNHALTLQSIAEGKADIGAFGSEEYDKAIRSGSTSRNQLRLLWRSGAIPLGPVMYRRDLSERNVKLLCDVLQSLHTTDLAALQSIKDAWTEAKPASHFQLIDDHYYKQKMDLRSPESIRIIRQFAQ